MLIDLPLLHTAKSDNYLMIWAADGVAVGIPTTAFDRFVVCFGSGELPHDVPFSEGALRYYRSMIRPTIQAHRELNLTSLRGYWEALDCGLAGVARRIRQKETSQDESLPSFPPQASEEIITAFQCVQEALRAFVKLYGMSEEASDTIARP